ncbi:hypothetical protein MIS45_07515 [Wielerella bovis]|uniref:hypothetical protein n=1 Tax=Wielerella bovis TaxID=2917790 RepID=UPI002019EA09|nr:hypothetical protein [Wielerella bovis]ULJ68643.1 hypothetical protein MIS45_07515 [Wielerella bovis]
MAAFILMMDNALSKSLFEIKILVIDNSLAPEKIKSINEIRLINFKGKIFAGCGKSNFNPLYKNNYLIRNRTPFNQLPVSVESCLLLSGK